jgi:hypothetical protein
MVLMAIWGIVLFSLNAFSQNEFLKKGREGNILFLSGGVGLTERDILDQEGKRYSLKLVFSNKKGEYLSDVVVKLFDQQDKEILTTVSNGPWLFIDLPSGIYHLEASFKTEKRKVPNFKIERGIQKFISIQWEE